MFVFLPVLSFAQEHARVLSRSITYTIRNDQEVEIQESYRLQINSDQGLRQGTYINYIDQFRKIAEVSLDIYDNQGKRIKRMKRADGLEIGFNPSYEISDAKVLVIDPDYQNFPFVVEVNAKVKLNGYLSLPTWIPRSSFNVAVDYSQLVIIRPKDLKLSIKEEFITGRTSSNEGNQVTIYEVSNLPAIEPKIRYKDFYDAAPKVLVSPNQFKLDNRAGSFESWTSFGEWYLQLNSKPYNLDQNSRQLIDSIDKSDSRYVIQRLYEYMQDKVRYVSIQLGIGGFASLPTEDVEKYGYGDCKALSTYMKNLLDYAGIKSNYILVRAGDDVADVEADFPSNQFNHVYLGIPLKTDTVFLECTSQITPYGYTGTFTDDRNVLWIEKDASRIIRSKVYPHLENKRDSKIKIELDEVGDALLEQTITNEGVFFDEILLFKSAPASYIEGYNQKKFDYSDFSIKDFSYKQKDRTIPSFESIYKIQIKGLAKSAGTRLVLPMIPTSHGKEFFDTDALMRYYSIKRGVTVEDDIIISVPKTMWVLSLPEKETITTRFGIYSQEAQYDNGILKVRRHLILYKGDYKEEEYEEFKKFHQQIERLESRKLVLNSKT